MKRQTIRFSAAATALAIALGFALPAPAQQAAPPLTLEAAERAFGLGQASDQLDYDSRRASADRITYQDVALNDFVEADRMTLRVVPGDRGRTEAVVRLEGARLTGLDGFSLRAVELTGIDPRLIGPELFDFAALMSGEIEIAGDLQLEGLEFRLDDETPPVRLARIRLDNIDTTEGYASFDAFEMNGFSYKVPETEMTLDTIRVAGISDAIFSLGASLGESGEIDVSQLTVDEFTIKGVSITGLTGLSGLLADFQEDPRAGARKALAAARDWMVALREGETPVQLAMLGQPSDDGGGADPEAMPDDTGMSVDFRLGEFTLRDIGLFERLDFVMKGLNTSYVINDTSSRFSLDELSFDDFNMAMITALGLSDLVGDLPEAVMNRTLASFVPEGPAGMSMTRFAVQGLSFAGEGVSVTLDRFAFNPIKDSAGRIVALETPAGRMAIRDTTQSGPFSETLTMFGLQELAINVLPSRSTWDPATDMMVQEAFGVSLPQLFSASMDGSAKGYQAWMEQTTLAELAANQLAAVEAAMAGSEDAPAAYDGPPPPPPEPLSSALAAMAESLEIYGGVELHRFGFTIRDEGVLASTARFAAQKDGITPDEARIAMASSLASTAADKSKPLWERLFANAMRGFVTEGGAVSVRMTPTPPLAFNQIDDAEVDTARLGMRIDHAPAVAGRN